MRRPPHIRIAIVIVGLAVAAWGGAAPRVTPAATRAELESWLVDLGAEGTPRRWLYTFVGGDDRRVEALSLTLVAAGYEIVRLGRASPDAEVELVVARFEPHTPASLERRQADLSVTARRGGVRYLGVDAA